MAYLLLKNHCWLPLWFDNIMSGNLMNSIKLYVEKNQKYKGFSAKMCSFNFLDTKLQGANFIKSRSLKFYYIRFVLYWRVFKDILKDRQVKH